MHKMKKMHNIGIIGYGGFGLFLHNAWKKEKNMRIVAVSRRTMKQIPKGNVKFYLDWKDLIKDKNVEIVVIATPPSSHATIACAALNAGKHVLIEKPIAITVKDAKKIIQTRKKTKKVAGIDFMLRFNPIIESLAKLSKKKIFGELRRVDVENYAQDEGLPIGHWFWDPKISGGILIEHAVHFIDMVNSLTNQKYKTVTGACYSRNNTQEDQVMANIVYNKGLISTQYHSFSRPGFFETTSIRLSFDLAEIDLYGWMPLSGNIKAIVNRKTKKELLKIPGLKVDHTHKIGHVQDDSRPKVWGVGDKNLKTKKKAHKIRSGGKTYGVSELIIGEIKLKHSKDIVYQKSVRALMKDFINKVEDTKHSPRVTLKDGLHSLEIASLATKFGRKRK